MPEPTTASPASMGEPLSEAERLGPEKLGDHELKWMRERVAEWQSGKEPRPNQPEIIVTRLLDELERQKASFVDGLRDVLRDRDRKVNEARDEMYTVDARNTELRTELATVSKRSTGYKAELDRVIRESAADKAKLAAVHDVITPKNPDWKPLSERYPEHFTPDTPEEAARKKGWGQGEEMLTRMIRYALDGPTAAPEMPRPPATMDAPAVSTAGGSTGVTEPENLAQESEVES